VKITNNYVNESSILYTVVGCTIVSVWIRDSCMIQ